jgi:pilus assembly protein CpaC
VTLFPARSVRRWSLSVAAVAAAATLPVSAHAQRVVSQPQQVISVSRGASALLVNPSNIVRITIGDPAVADANVVSPTEVVVNGKTLGSTTLLVWDNTASPKIYSVEVTADAAAIQRFIRAVMPDENIEVSSSGNTVTLSGTVKDAVSATRAVEIAKTSGATVIENLFTPPAVQVALHVRFAEISRSTMKDWSSALSAVNPQRLNSDGDYEVSTTPEGQIGFFLASGGANIEALIQAAKTRGDFRSLAEPNLMTLPGKEAYFLAGGEFPFPTLQAGAQAGGVTIIFKEFGIRLRFTPTILRSGAIRLALQPEVSSLDFANGLVLNGFEIPTILTRRAETEVEMREGQYLAIAGLLDNNMVNNVTKIPILGDIPILGELFKSRSVRQRKTELLVLITPRLVTAGPTPTPLPTGEPNADWRLDGFITDSLKMKAGTRPELPPGAAPPAAAPQAAPR